MILLPPDPPYGPNGLPPAAEDCPPVAPVPNPPGSIDLLVVGTMLVAGGAPPGLSHQWYVNPSPVAAPQMPVNQ